MNISLNFVIEINNKKLMRLISNTIIYNNFINTNCYKRKCDGKKRREHIKIYIDNFKN